MRILPSPSASSLAARDQFTEHNGTNKYDRLLVTCSTRDINKQKNNSLEL
jgi:hypothetical protein